MSITEIDDLSYNRIFTEQVARYLRMGYTMVEAHAFAGALLAECFIPTSAAVAIEDRKDHRDDRLGLTT